MKKLLPLLKIITALAALVLEFFPNGIAMTSRFPVEGTSEWGKAVSYHSYVDPVVPFGAANFLPPITVLLTVAILVIIVISIIKETRSLDKLVFILAIIAVVTSLPLLYGFYSYTLIGLIITVLLLANAIFSFYDIEKRP